MSDKVFARVPGFGALASRFVAAAFLMSCCFCAASSAKADIFNVNAVVGDLFGYTVPGPYTGLAITGTVDVSGGQIAGVDLSVQDDPNIFTNLLTDNPSFFSSSGFAEYGQLFLTPSGFIGSGSWIYLDSPVGFGDGTGLGSGGEGEQYQLVAPILLPEPSALELLGTVLVGFVATVLRSRRAVVS
jgi:hypothetical protein